MHNLLYQILRCSCGKTSDQKHTRKKELMCVHNSRGIGSIMAGKTRVPAGAGSWHVALSCTCRKQTEQEEVQNFKRQSIPLVMCFLQQETTFNGYRISASSATDKGLSITTHEGFRCHFFCFHAPPPI